MGPAAVRRKGKGMGISGMAVVRGKSSKHRVSSGLWPALCEAVRTDSWFVGYEPIRENGYGVNDAKGKTMVARFIIVLSAPCAHKGFDPSGEVRKRAVALGA
jgi:hypothetical protein